MKSRVVRLVLADLNEELNFVETYIRPHGQAAFAADPVMLRATERAIQNISEAVRLMPSDLLADYPAIPWKQIKEIGSVLRHDYHNTSPTILWKVVTDHLAPLAKALAEIELKLSEQLGT